MKDSYQEFYNYIIKVLSISKIGLVFSKDQYAITNYKKQRGTYIPVTTFITKALS